MLGCPRLDGPGKERGLFSGLSQMFKGDGNVSNPGAPLEELFKDLSGLVIHDVFPVGCIRETDGPGRDLTVGIAAEDADATALLAILA